MLTFLDIELRKHIATFEDGKLATLHVDFQQDRVSETVNVDARVEPLDRHFNRPRAAFLALSRSEQ
jgi:hypothetical protein